MASEISLPSTHSSFSEFYSSSAFVLSLRSLNTLRASPVSTVVVASSFLPRYLSRVPLTQFPTFHSRLFYVIPTLCTKRSHHSLSTRGKPSSALQSQLPASNMRPHLVTFHSPPSPPTKYPDIFISLSVAATASEHLPTRSH